MTATPRAKAQSAVGVSITDTVLRYIEFTVVNEELSLGAFGQIGIAYDAVDGGKIDSIHQLTDSIRMLRSKTTAKHLLFPSWGDASLDDTWQEAFTIGGFTTVSSAPRPELVTLLTADKGGSALPTLHWTPYGTLDLIDNNQQVLSVSAPLANIDDIFSLQDKAAEHYAGETIVMVGQGPNEDPDVTTAEMHELGLEVRWANIWKNCLAIASTVPPIPYKQAFGFSLAIASALAGARYTFSNSTPTTPPTEPAPTTPEINQRPSALETLMASSAQQGPTVPTDTSVPPQPAPAVVQQTQTTPPEAATPTPPVPKPGSLRDTLEKQGAMPTMTPEQEPAKMLAREKQTAEKKPEPSHQTPPSNSAPTTTDKGASTKKRSIWMQDADEIIKSLTSKKK